MSDDETEKSAEDEEGDSGSADFDGEGDGPERDESAQIGTAGAKLEEHAEPLLAGPATDTPAGPVPTRSLLSILVFIVVFCAAFFLLWALIGGFGIVLGIILGTALGLAAMKLMATRYS